MMGAVLDAKSLRERMARGERPRVIDVREPDEFARGHVPGAVCVPTELLGSVAGQWRDDCATVVVCWSGQRAGAAAAHLRGMGLNEVTVLAGGTKAWAAAGLPVEREKTGIPLMRQVILAMGLIFAGLFVGSMWVPGLAWAGAAMGGLAIFAGATGVCPMAAVLSRAPWNRRRARAGACAEERCCGG